MIPPVINLRCFGSKAAEEKGRVELAMAALWIGIPLWLIGHINQGQKAKQFSQIGNILNNRHIASIVV